MVQTTGHMTSGRPSPSGLNSSCICSEFLAKVWYLFRTSGRVLAGPLWNSQSTYSPNMYWGQSCARHCARWCQGGKYCFPALYVATLSWGLEAEGVADHGTPDCNFSKMIILSWRQLRRSRYKESSLYSFHLPKNETSVLKGPLPGKTKANHQRRFEAPSAWRRYQRNLHNKCYKPIFIYHAFPKYLPSHS